MSSGVPGHRLQCTRVLKRLPSCTHNMTSGDKAEAKSWKSGKRRVIHMKYMLYLCDKSVYVGWLMIKQLFSFIAFPPSHKQCAIYSTDFSPWKYCLCIDFVQGVTELKKGSSSQKNVAKMKTLHLHSLLHAYRKHKQRQVHQEHNSLHVMLWKYPLQIHSETATVGVQCSWTELKFPLSTKPLIFTDLKAELVFSAFRSNPL